MEPKTPKNRQTMKKYPKSGTETKSKQAKKPVVTYGKQQFSYAEYLHWSDNKMREIINGMVYSFSAPFRKHAEVTISFLKKVLPYIDRRKGKCKVYHAPFDVRLPLNGETADDEIYNVVQPDICVICDLSKLDERGCIGAPDLIVEVFSPSTGKRDMNEKYFLYEAAGVKEYWLVYPDSKAVTKFLLHDDGKYDDGTTYEVINGETKVPIEVLEGLVVDLEDLFQGLS